MAADDLARLFAGLDSTDVAAEALNDTLPALIEAYGAAVATYTADWYDDLRDERGIRGRFTANPADIADPGAYALIGWASDTATDLDAMLSLTQGGTQRRIANFSRFTVQESAVRDPRARGWVRVGEGKCKSGWCDQYLDGEVRTVAYDFKAHDGCNCHATPAWR